MTPLLTHLKEARRFIKAAGKYIDIAEGAGVTPVTVRAAVRLAQLFVLHADKQILMADSYVKE